MYIQQLDTTRPRKLMRSWDLQQHGRPRCYNVNWNKSIRERQKPYGFTHMWNLGTNQMNKGKKKEQQQQQ